MENKYPYYKISAIRELLENEKMAPLKKWGQNFLMNPQITTAIIHALPDDIIASAPAFAEIGPGLGVLSWEIVKFGKPYFIFEIDPFFAGRIRHNPLFQKGHITLYEGDFLQNIDKIISEKIILYGNLPYHISSEIITSILEKLPGLVGASFLVQKEFAWRLVHEMSSLSVFAAAFGRWKLVKTVGPKNFYPPPKIDSAIITFIPYEKNDQVLATKAETELLTLLLKTIFWGKRKQIGTSIKNAPFIQSEELKKKIISSLSELRISPETRPEQLKKEEIYRLVQLLGVT